MIRQDDEAAGDAGEGDSVPYGAKVPVRRLHWMPQLSLYLNQDVPPAFSDNPILVTAGQTVYGYELPCK